MHGQTVLTTRREAETVYIGQVLGRAVSLPLVIALNGELGTGKTALARGIAKGLGVTQTVTSPTFILLNIYSGRLPVYHFDFYRLPEKEIYWLGFEDYLPGEGVAIIEWADRFPEIIPSRHLNITLERFFDAEGEGRRLQFTPHDQSSSLLVEDILNRISWKIDGGLHLESTGPDCKEV